MADSIRRIVTGNDAGGKSDVVFDSIDPHRLVIPGANIVDRVLWLAGETPSDVSVRQDPVRPDTPISPPDGGHVFRIVDFPPFREGPVKPDLVRSLVGGEAAKSDTPPPHPMMHRTRTLDYALVLEGEIDMLLDRRTVHCRAGDVVVQQGTTHAWVNRSERICRVAFVMIDAKE